MMHEFLAKVSHHYKQIYLMFAYNAKFQVPGWVGRLPMRVGEPAGGSLTADEYRHLMVGPGCIIVCIGRFINILPS